MFFSQKICILKIKLKIMSKKRDINSYRQVKDAVYRTPNSHHKAKKSTTIEKVLTKLMKSHSLLVENYQGEDRNEILSDIERLIVRLHQ